MRMLKKGVRAEYWALIQRFRLIDDTFFNVCFDNYIEGMQLLLRIFFGRDDLVVKHVVAQRSTDNLYGRGVRFDVLAEDSEGKIYDCEVQRANKGAIPRRARYNSSMMDARELAKGEEYSKLPETWVIFITENDIYGVGFPLYHVERIVQELQRLFDDGAHILYVNGANRDDTPLGRLMQDFFCENPEQMNYKELAERADYFKAGAEGVNTMCELMEKFGEKKMEEGRLEGRLEGQRRMLDMARSLVALNVPLDVIEKASGLTRAEILALQDTSSK
ncbi:Rpn family recombination-promoting nuclease/putative transposase [Selenomonas sputigena]|nr:Rpn family recombination-promoting nuclease/putative transposase [Selenomonas sputigena]UZD43552.1 Rpn family recombination-promoting nuclease/putative transposase [Selenomonas sputigena]